MDIRRFFNDGEKGKDDSSEKKRPTEEGASARPPPPKRKFQQLWKCNFPWVIHQDGAMFYTWCVEKNNLSNYSSAFITGGRSNFCSESLRSHAGSVGHKRAEDSFRIAANPQETAIPRALRQLDKEAVSKLEKLFDNAYFVAKLEMPFTTYPHLCQLEQKHGIEPWQTYRTDKACKSFRMAISKLFKSELEEQVQRACFLSIMTDSATDAGVREVEDMYVHFLKDEEAVNAFVGLKSCSNAKAPGITDAVNSAMTDV